MTKEAKMLAVVEAARHLITANLGRTMPGAGRLQYALAALDAHTEADAETVTLEAWSHFDGDVVLVLPGSPLARKYPGNDYRQYRGTVTLPITREGGR